MPKTKTAKPTKGDLWLKSVLGVDVQQAREDAPRLVERSISFADARAKFEGSSADADSTQSPGDPPSVPPNILL